MPILADFLSVVENETDKAVLLTASSIALLFTALGEYLEKSDNWVGSADFGKLTDEEKDEVDAIIAKAERELMTESECETVAQTGIIFMSPADREGSLLCDGTQYHRVDYPDLYAFLVDTPYIDDADHFHVPNMLDVFVLGSDTPDDTGGEATHVLSTNELPSHNHQESDRVGDAAFTWTGTTGAYKTLGAGSTNSNTGVLTTQNRGGGQAHNNMPPYITMRFYIWT